MGTDKRILVDSFADEIIRKRHWDIYFNSTLRAPVKTLTIVESGRPKDVVVWRNDTASLRKELQCFFANLNHYSVFYTKYILALVFFERQYQGARIHIHAFIQGIRSEYSYALQSLACDFFGASKVEPYDPAKGARYYLGWKFVKPELCDFDFMKINSRARKRPAVEWEIPLKE